MAKKIKSTQEIVERPVEVLTVTEVKNEGKKDYSVQLSDGFCVFILGKHGVEPKVGMRISLWGKRFGFIRGIALDNNVLFYRTVDEQEEQHKKDVEKANKQAKAKFLKDKAKLDAQYNALPDCFQRRLNKFRTNNPDFRWRFEAYEMFCCTEAMKMVNYIGSASSKITKDDFIDGKFDEKLLDNEAKLDNKEHSGNTHGMAVFLARLYFKDPEDVVKLHGALAPLVGSEEYGCVPRKKQ